MPHDKPEVVHAFLVKKFSEYIAAHPGELREARDPGRDLTGKPVQAAVRVYTSNEWVARTDRRCRGTFVAEDLQAVPCAEDGSGAEIICQCGTGADDGEVDAACEIRS